MGLNTRIVNKILFLALCIWLILSFKIFLSKLGANYYQYKLMGIRVGQNYVKLEFCCRVFPIFKLVYKMEVECFFPHAGMKYTLLVGGGLRG